MIGIGAGPATDGQVLVFHDLLGIYDGHAARFVKRYADVRAQMVKGVSAFAADVRERRYPSPSTATRWRRTRWTRLRDLLSDADRRAVHRRAPPLRSASGGELRFSTEGDGDVVDITAGVESVVASPGLTAGLVSVFVPGSTAAITAMEHEPGGVHDLREALDRLVPQRGRLRAQPPERATPTPTPTSGPRSWAPRRPCPCATGGSSSAPGSSSCSWISTIARGNAPCWSTSWAESPNMQASFGLACRATARAMEVQ